MANWWYALSVDVTTGSKQVKVNNGDDIRYLERGSAYLKISGSEAVETDGAFENAQGEKIIRLAKDWPGQTDTARPATAFRTVPDFQSVADKLALNIERSQEVVDNVISKMGTLLTSTDEVVVIETSEGDVEVVPYGKLAQMLQDQIDYFNVTELTIPGVTNPQSNITLFIPDSLRAQVEYATQGKNTVLYNANGDPNIMVPIYKFRYEDLGFAGDPFGSGVATAFMKGGVEKSEIFIGAFQGRSHNGQVVTLPNIDPTTSINFDNAKSACEANGPGWHLMSEHEWAAIALWCMANGFEPRGNTNYGRAHDANHENGRRQDAGIAGDASGTARTITGSGPATWRHDGSPFGIADLTGNIWEWSDQLKLIDGRVHCTEDNNFEALEADWVPQGHYLSNESGTLTLKNAPGTHNEDGLSVDWGALAKESGYSESLLLQRLLLSPAGVHPQGRLYARTGGERLPCRGGRWSSSSNAGLAARGLSNERSGAGSPIGFRPAFVA